MVVVAQLVERQIVILNVAGSSPVDHPILYNSRNSDTRKHKRKLNQRTKGRGARIHVPFFVFGGHCLSFRGACGAGIVVQPIENLETVGGWLKELKDRPQESFLLRRGGLTLAIQRAVEIISADRPTLRNKWIMVCLACWHQFVAV